MVRIQQQLFFNVSTFLVSHYFSLASRWLDAVMGALSYSFGQFYPARKITSLILLKPHKRYARVPSTLHDALDDAPSKPVFYRPWLLFVFMLPLLYYVCRIDGINLYHKHGGVVIATNDMPVLKQMKVGDNSTSVEVFDETTGTDILPHGRCELNVGYTTGNLTINLNVSNDAAFVVNSLIAEGGHYKPPNCKAQHRLAIIVAYRHRERNLAIFLTNIHTFLINQQIEYRIYIIEQDGQERFNKGRLMNAGFDQAKEDWDCFIFHDVDLLPLDTRILYTCPIYPRHMSTTVYVGDKIINFTQFFGGVTAMTKEHFVAVNGFSNRFWGWGGEDNDMFWRIRILNLPIMRYSKDIARYIMLPHDRPELNQNRYQILKKYSKSLSKLRTNGLSTLKYIAVFKKLYSLFTHIIVDINPYKDPDE